MKTLKTLLISALLAVSAPQLTGCVPVVATGVGAGIMIIDDRRTPATYLLDQEIEFKLAGELREQFGENTRALVTSFNRRVMLTGQVPDEATRTRIENIARAAQNVREVQNELSIGTPVGLTTRAADTYTSALVKARFLEDKRFNANHVKVVTENATVYLMGVVKREEGIAAAQVAARTKGVQKVVKIFEYLD